MVKLPQGWSVEMLGLIESVKFTRSGQGRVSLLWSDGVWMMGMGQAHVSAPGVPSARTMDEARRVGTAWLAEHAER
jgi:hypothetical protein